MDEENDEAKPSDHDGQSTAARRTGRWVSLGGKLRWVPFHALDSAEAAEEEEDGEADLPPGDADAWESDIPPIPSGATEAVRVRAALHWLERQTVLAQERLGQLALQAHDALLEQESETPRRRRGPVQPTAIALAIAAAEGIAAWFEDSTILLRDAADHTPGRALVEWYLALQAEVGPEIDASDPLAVARAAGRDAARDRILRYAELLAMPEADDEE